MSEGQVDFHSEFKYNYDIEDFIGAGASGTVYKCKQIRFLNVEEEERVVAVKLIEFTEKEENKVINEVKLLRQLINPNIIKIFKSWVEYPPARYKYPDRNPLNRHSKGAILIETEFCELESLRHWFQKDWRKREHAQIFIYQITSGVQYLHEKKIIHRDMKPENILLRKDAFSNFLTAKICDFGISREVAKSMTSKVGTYGYLSPEVRKGRKYTKKADIYAIGVMFYEMLILGDKKNEDLSDSLFCMMLNELTNYEFEFLPECEHLISSKEKDLIGSMVEIDAENRPHSKDILATLANIYPHIESMKITTGADASQNETDTLASHGNKYYGVERTEHNDGRIFYQYPTIPEKWWPEKKRLPNAFYERKSDNCLLIEKLKEMLSKNSSDGMAVITQQVTVSGLGGIGKTTTAIWFAQKYQEEYDHIFWIDCGEKSLLNSFKNLAVDLDMKNRAEKNHDVKLLAVRAFQILKERKCLFIFDNAECYIGNEGIKEVLPNWNKNFSVLITSRNKDWGDANGDGKIPQFQLNVFNQNESVQLMKKNIAVLPENADSLLHLLCDLLGNLPLAIQIAIAFLNRQKIVNLQTYIDKIKSTPEILHEKFDNYEKTIYKTMKISIDIIQNHESNDERRIGEISCKILSIFGFITPDNVPATFFMAVEARRMKPLERIKTTLFNVGFQTAIYEETEIDEATRVLEQYSLVTRNNGSATHYKYTLSIHRLLQQVMRFNSNSSEEQILTQVLKCDGFLEYKLIPFSYAAEKLQKRFPKIKAELIDKLKLKQLISERRFHEAVELSRLIKDALKTPVSHYNFAVCLKHNNELSECENEFERLRKQIGETNKCILSRYSFKLETVKSDTQITSGMLKGQLLLTYIQQQNVKRARNSLLEWKSVTLPNLPLNYLVHFPALISLSNLFFEHHEERNCITLKVENYEQPSMKFQLKFWGFDQYSDFAQGKLSQFTLTDITLQYCSVNLSILSPVLKKLTLSDCFLINYFKLSSVKENLNCLEELSLINTFSTEMKYGGRCLPINIPKFICLNLKKLYVKACKCMRFWISLDDLTSIQSLYLSGCGFVYVPNIHIAPSELTLKNVRIIDNYATILNHVLVNTFVNFKQTNYLSVTGMSIDFCEPVNMKELILINANVVNWESSPWVVEKLSIFPAAGPTQMNIRQMVILKDELADCDTLQTKENYEGTLTTQINSKKRNVLSYFRRIANYKTISGLYMYANGAGESIEWVAQKMRKIARVSPGIISAQMTGSTYSERNWPSFITQVISNWNNHHFVRIEWLSGFSLFTDMNKIDDTESRWEDWIRDGGELNKVWKEELDIIAPYLHELQIAGVVAIFDILPIINHKRYIWGGHSGVNGSAKLYQITHDYLTKEHNINSIIWNWSIDPTDMTEFEKFWPGSDYVDVASVYMGEINELPMSEYERLLNLVGDKPLSMERMFTIPSVKILAAQPRWTWFTVFNFPLETTYFHDAKSFEFEATLNTESVINHGHIDFFYENN